MLSRRETVKELIKVETRKIGNEEIQAVSAKELYLGLGLSPTQWARWSKENIEKNFFFIEGKDFIGLDIMSNGNKTRDYAISIELAKHIAMQAKTPNSHEYRNYMIECEQKLKESQSNKTPAELLLEQVQLLVKHEREIAETKRLAYEAHQRLDQIETGIDHFTVIGYARTFLKQSLPLKDASKFGRDATQFCEAMGILMGAVPDPRFGQVNTYPKSVLDEVFSIH